MPVESISFAVVAPALSPDPHVVPELSRRAGFAGLQFDAYATDLALPDLSATGRREFRHLLSGQDQRLVGLRFDLGPKGLGPGADVDRALDRLGRVMEAAAGLMAPLVCVEVGPLPEPVVEEKAKPKITTEQAGLILIPGDLGGGASAKPQAAGRATEAPDPDFLAQVDGAMAELGVRADRYGVTVAFCSELASFAALERTLAAARCPWFGVDLDPVAVLRDDWDVDEVFSRLGGLIRHVRGRDAVRGADRRTKPAVVGRGGTNWGELLANLDAAGYHGWVTVDPVDPVDLTDRPAAAVAALEHLRRVGA